MWNVDLNGLKGFVSVVQGGGFTAAARSQSDRPRTISRRLKALEVAIGAKLIQRSTPRMVSTSAGIELFGKCRQASSRISRALTEAKSAAITAHVIRVAAPIGFFDYINPAWIGELLTKYPEVNVEMTFNDFDVWSPAWCGDINIKVGAL